MNPSIRSSGRAALLGLALVALSRLHAQESRDAYGDPLPEDVVFRLGTTRYRQGGKINCIAVSPDSKTVLTGSTNYSMTLWDLESGRRLRTCEGHEGPVFSVAYSPDGRTGVSGGRDENVILWDLESGKATRTLKAGMTVHRVSFTPDGKTILAACDEGKVQLWNGTTGTLDRLIEGPPGEVLGLALRPDGSSCFTAGKDPLIHRWDLATGKKIRTFAGHGKPVFGLAVSANGKVLASISDDRSVGLWDIDSGDPIRKIMIPDAYPTYIGLSSDGESVLASQNWIHPALWSVKTGARLTEFRDGHRDYVYAAAFSPDGKYIVSGGFDRLLVLWNRETGQAVHSFEAHQAELSGVAYSPDGSVLGTVGYDQSVSLWDVQTGKRLQASKSMDGRLYAISFSPDGRLLACGGSSPRIVVRDARSLKRVFDYPTNCVVNSTVFHPSSQVLFANQEVNTFAARELGSGKILRTFEGHTEVVKCLAITSDGRTIASGSYDHSIILWDYESGKQTRKLQGHKDAVFCLAFTAGGRYLVSGSKDRTMILWNAATGERIHAFEGFDDPVSAVAVSPDDQYVLASSWDRKSLLWDLWNHQLIRTLTGHVGGHQACAWSPGGGRFVTGSTDTSALVWDLDLKEAPAARRWAQEWTTLADAPKKAQMASVLADFESIPFDRWSRARRRLAALEEAGIPILTQQFPPESPPPGLKEADLDNLLAALDQDAPEDRAKARRQLEQYGPAAFPWMDRQLERSSLSAEVRSALGSIRNGSLAHPTVPRDLGRLRAVLLYADLLPRESARQALLRYAKGPEGSSSTQAAQRVLQFN